MLELVNLTKIYHTEDEGSLALKGISAKFPEKGFVAVTGESGSGKTTLLNILSGFVSYEEGDFFVDGQDFLSFSQEDIEKYRRNDIGFVFQDYHLIEHHTVLDNLIEVLLLHGVNLKEAKKRSLEILKKFGLYDQRKNKARNISSGQKQKLAIARALVKEPKIILCDEPTANLDPETGLVILAILKEYADNHLVIVSTHNYEDAKDFATHFMRIYKGNLTTFETLKEVDNTPLVAEEKKKSDAFNIFKIGVKNQVPLTIGKVSVSAILTAGFIFLATLFAANIDETSTHIISHDSFNNINPNELIIMHKDRTLLTNDDLDNLANIPHAIGAQQYGLASEMNYYYRQDIDYEEKIVIVKEDVPAPGGGDVITIEYTEHRFNTLREDLYFKCHEGFIKQEDLISGALPTNFNDIVVYGDYEVGDTITVYFHDDVLQSSSYFKFDFVVSGLLKKKTEDAYFSPIFARSFDYMQFTSRQPTFRFYVNFQQYNPRSDTYSERGLTYSFNPIYKPELGPDEVQLSQRFVTDTESFPTKNINYQAIFFTDEQSNLAFQEITRHNVTVNAEYSEDIGYSYIYVGENIFHMFIDKYQPQTGRVYVDDYSHVDDVIRSLTNKKYDCLSAYRASSGEIDGDKQVKRAVSLIVSLALLIVGSFVYVIFGYLLERGKITVDKTLHLLGGSISDLRKTSIIQISFANLLGLIVGFLLYLIVYFLPIAYIQEVNLYLRFYHFLIVLGMVILISVFIYLLYIKYLAKKTKKRSAI